jgi:hypothetical protein
MAAKDAHTCGSLLFSVLDMRSTGGMLCMLRFVVCDVCSLPKLACVYFRSEDRSEVDSGTWQPRAADKTNRCWDWERIGGV